MSKALESTVRRIALAGVTATLALVAPQPAEADPPPRLAIQKSKAAVPPRGTNLVEALRPSRAALAQSATGTSTLAYPYGLGLDVNGNLYVANYLGGVTIYNAKFQRVGGFTAGVQYPTGVQVAFGGNIYVANQTSKNLTIFNPSLQQIGTISDASLAIPLSLYIDASNTIWVLDSAGVVHAYLDNATALPTVKTGGTAIGPWGPDVTVWGISNTSSGGYDEDFQNRDEAVRNNPAFPNSFPNGSPLAGGETQDDLGQQYVTDYTNNAVQIWNSASTVVTGYFTVPSTPIGIAVDTHRQRIYVSLPKLNQIAVYSTVSPYKLLHTIY